MSHCFNLHFPDDIWCGAPFHILVTICRSSLVRCLLRSLAHFQSGCLFSYCWVLRVLYTFWIIVLYQMCLVNISQLIGLSSNFCGSFCCRAEVLNFNEVQSIKFFFMDHALNVSQNSSPNTRSHRFPLIFFMKL